MKELLGSARNIHLIMDEKTGDIHPMIESVIITTEPLFVLDESGNIVRKRETSSFRFHATPDGLRTVAEQFNEWADQADGLMPKAKENVDEPPK